MDFGRSGGEAVTVEEMVPGRTYIMVIDRTVMGKSEAMKLVGELHNRRIECFVMMVGGGRASIFSVWSFFKWWILGWPLLP